MRVTYLIALENGTWDTITVEVPKRAGTKRETLVKWAEENLAGQAQYRKVELFAFWGIEE
jgi:hypothetical protein